MRRISRDEVLLQIQSDLLAKTGNLIDLEYLEALFEILRENETYKTALEKNPSEQDDN